MPEIPNVLKKTLTLVEAGTLVSDLRRIENEDRKSGFSNVELVAARSLLVGNKGFFRSQFSITGRLLSDMINQIDTAKKLGEKLAEDCKNDCAKDPADANTSCDAACSHSVELEIVEGPTVEFGAMAKLTPTGPGLKDDPRAKAKAREK